VTGAWAGIEAGPGCKVGKASFCLIPDRRAAPSCPGPCRRPRTQGSAQQFVDDSKAARKPGSDPGLVGRDPLCTKGPLVVLLRRRQAATRRSFSECRMPAPGAHRWGQARGRSRRSGPGGPGATRQPPRQHPRSRSPGPRAGWVFETGPGRTTSSLLTAGSPKWCCARCMWWQKETRSAWGVEARELLVCSAVRVRRSRDGDRFRGRPGDGELRALGGLLTRTGGFPARRAAAHDS